MANGYEYLVGNKTNVIQKVYDRVSGLTDYGFKEIRIGSVDAARKHTDLPILWVGLESGREAGNFKNGASVDTMRVSLSILDNKLKLTNNTLFRVPENGGGDTYTISNEAAVSVQDDILSWFGALNTRQITTSTGVNGAEIITTGASNAISSVALSIGANGSQDLAFTEFMGQLQYRALTVGDSVVNVLCNTSALPGFSYNGVSLGSPVNIAFEGGALALLQNIKRHTLSILDYSGASKGAFTIYTYNTGSAVTGDSVTMGMPGAGALIRLEMVLDALDVNPSGTPDITIGGAANNRRDIDYTVDASGDYVLVQAFIDVESSIFINGSRSG
jgi:hypothetical protein